MKMTKLITWLRWPENKRTGRLPWFIAVWRLIWAPVIYTGILIICIGMFGCHGIKGVSSVLRRLLQ